jgi:hypothetical protein
MRINLSSVYDLTIPSFKQFPLTLTPRQKIISLIALVALTAMTFVGFMVYKFMAKKVDSSPKEKKNDHVEKQDSPEEKKGDNIKKLDSPKEKKGDIQHVENLEDKKLKSGNKEEQKTPGEIKQKSEEVTLKPDQIDKGLEKEDMIRIAYQGLLMGEIDKSKWLNETQMENLAQKLKESIVKRAHQDDYSNKNLSLFCVDYNDFGVENDIDGFKLEALIRYLILKEEVFSYCRRRKGFCLYLDKEIHDNRNHQQYKTCHTKQKLEEADACVESMIFPSLDACDEKELPVAKEVIKAIKKAQYQRVLDDEIDSEKCELLIEFYPQRFLTDLMDGLVANELIHSWNVYQRNNEICVKLKADDLVKDPSFFRWKSWRDVEEIERETQFRKENCVSISEQARVASDLSFAEKKALDELLEELNKRTHFGSFEFRGGYQSDKILGFLKAQNAIFDYQKKGWQNDYVIFVKSSDVPNKEK